MFKNLLYILLLVTLVSNGSFFAQNISVIDSMMGSLELAEEDTLKAQLLKDISWEYMRIDPQKMKLYANKLIEFSKRIEYKAGLADGYNNLGLAYYYLTQYDSSIFHHENALKIRKDINDEYGIAISYNNIGITYTNQNKFEQAIEVWLKSIEIKEKSSSEKLRKGLGSSYGNMGSLFSRMENYEKAKEYYERSLEIFKKQDNKWGQMMCIGNLANANKNLEEYDKSFELYPEAIALAIVLESTFDQAIHMFNYGEALARVRKYEEAEKEILKAMKLQIEVEDYEGIAISNIVLSEIKKYKKQKKEAINYAIKGFEVCNKYKVTTQIPEALQNLVETYKSFGMYEKALHYFEQKSSFEDSLKVIANNNKVVELEAKFKTEQKEKEIVKLEAEKQIEKLALSKKTNERNIIIGVAAVLLLGLVFSFFFWKQKQNNAVKTIALNQEKINTLLKENEINYVNAMIEGQETERKRIAADLHDRLGSMLATVKLHFSSEKKGGIEKGQTLLDQSVEEVRKISHNLASSSLVKFGLIASLQSLSESISSNKFRVDFLHHGIEERLSSETEISLYRCVQELISNIIRHANASKITIQLQKNNNDLNLIVEDNGIGFNTKQKSSGIGLKNITSRVKSLKGNIAFDSSINKGTTVIIDIPLES